MKILRAWLERRRRLQEMAGFDYTAGALLMGVNPERLYAESVDPIDGIQDFERGMQKALSMWEAREFAKELTQDEVEQGEHA